MQISTTLTSTPTDDARLAEILANPGFGVNFTDHMFTVEWTPDAGVRRKILADNPARLYGFAE